MFAVYSYGAKWPQRENLWAKGILQEKIILELYKNQIDTLEINKTIKNAK